MAINAAFEPDNGEETSASSIPTSKNTSNDVHNKRTPNENTALNLDTYFADEKIIIPDRVSDANVYENVQNLIENCLQSLK